MPYIKPADRNRLDDSLSSLAAKIVVEEPSTQAGVLNYCISALFNEVLKTRGLNYRNLNELVGVLECAKLEIYRRVAAPYEDGKILDNGDVFITDSPVKCRKPLAHNPQFEGKHHCRACERELKSE